jgi:hypothetical protein
LSIMCIEALIATVAVVLSDCVLAVITRQLSHVIIFEGLFYYDRRPKSLITGQLELVRGQSDNSAGSYVDLAIAGILRPGDRSH